LKEPHTNTMHIRTFVYNIPRPKKIYLVMNDKLGRSADKDTRPRKGDQTVIYPSVFSLSNLKRLVFNFFVSFLINFIL
jgi:hypothetical protein